MTALWGTPEVPAELATEAVTGGFDVAVVGAGLTGLTTALLLARTGARVVVLEARYVGAGTTGHSTAKVSLLQATRLSTISARHPRETVRAYVAGNRVGQDWLLAECRAHGVPVQRAGALTYAALPKHLPAAHAEHEAAVAAGLDVTWHDRLDVPFPAVGGVRLADQAQVDPAEVLGMLTAQALAAGVTIRTGARVTDAHGPDRTVVTTRGTVRADHVVLATGIPVADRGGFFARLSPERSYAVALGVPEPTGLDMAITAGSPTRSLRTAPWSGGEAVIVGGGSHVVGRARHPSAGVANLVSWARETFPGAQPLARWSAQDYHPAAELPYVGPLLPGDRRVLVATGFAKWGMANAVAAAHLLCDTLTGELPDWAGAFASWSRHELRGLSAALRLNTGVAARLAGGYATALGSAPPSPAPAEGTGEVHRDGVRPVAVATVDGVTRSRCAVCPHLGGIVRWNDEEGSWDCPLHGSRFAPDGTLLEGPSTRGLYES